MQKDLKIGLLSGLVLVSGAVVWLATRPSLSPQSRTPDIGIAGVGREVNNAQAASHKTSAGDAGREREVLIPSGAAVPPGRTDSVEKVAPTPTPAPPAPEQSNRTVRLRTHVVRDGETLSEISQAYYGSATKWKMIFEANRRTIRNPNVVMPGTKLIIPE